MKTRLVSIICCLAFILPAVAQESSTTYKSEIFGSFSSGDNTPFWMLYHNWGMVPLESNNFYVRGDVYHSRKINTDWSFKLGLSLAGSSPHSYGTIWVQQAFGEINWRGVRLSIGAKEDYSSIYDEYLTSGDFDKSNNTRPHPELKFSLPDFILLPYTNENLYLKADFSLGKFMDGDWQEDFARPYNQHYTKDVLSHNKSVYFRWGNTKKTDNNWQLTAGLDHQAQWGGKLYRYNAETNDYDVHKQPQDFDGLWRVLTLKEGGDNASTADRAFVAGSHIGSYHLRFDYKLKETNHLSAYIQHFFEDGSGMAFKNYQDMLLGIQYKSDKKQLLSNVLFEYIYTKNQSGPIHFNLELDEEHKYLHSKGTGNDNYYNNYDYVQGRSYYGRSMGTALFLSPEYNDNGNLNFKSNRIVSFHLGLEGYFNQDLGYRLLATTGQSWGRYYVPYLSVHDGFASNLDLLYSYPKVKGLDFKLSVGYNTGDFFGDDAFGAGITITKRGVIK